MIGEVDGVASVRRSGAEPTGGLTQLDGQLNPRPDLAERIESADQITWHIRLRKGVTFHDGANLTAQDVVWSLLRHKNPATGSKMAQIAEQFAQIKATGKQDLVIRLTDPNADLPAILAQSHFVILRAGTSDFRTANGTGPYLCAQFRPGVRTLGRRNPNFWKPGKPYLDEIELISIPDETSRVNALLSGDVQMINAVSPHSTKRIRESSGYAVLETKSGLFTDLVMRQDAAATGNPDLVLAMKYLFDRELIRKALFRGYAVIANDQPITMKELAELIIRISGKKLSPKIAGFGPETRQKEREIMRRIPSIEKLKALLKKVEGEQARERGLACPKCAGKLESYTFMGFFLDRCQACGGMWLDKGELEGILREASRSRLGAAIERFLARHQGASGERRN